MPVVVVDGCGSSVEMIPEKDSFPVKLIGIDNNNQIYINVVDKKHFDWYCKTQTLMKNMADFSESIPFYDLREGLGVIVREKKLWEGKVNIDYCRGRVVEVPGLPEQDILIFKMDEFKFIRARHTDLFLMSQDISTITPFAVKCYLKGLEFFNGMDSFEWSRKSNLLLRRDDPKSTMYMAKKVGIDCVEGTNILELTSEEEQEGKTLLSRIQLIIERQCKMAIPQVGKTANVVITHATKQGYVWFQYDDDEIMNRIRYFMEKFELSSLKEEDPNLELYPREDYWKYPYCDGDSEMLLAMYEGVYCRAKRKRLIKEKTWEIEYVDYGNLEIKDESDLIPARLYDENLCFIPPQCIKARYKGLPKIDVDCFWNETSKYTKLQVRVLSFVKENNFDVLNVDILVRQPEYVGNSEESMVPIELDFLPEWNVSTRVDFVPEFNNGFEEKRTFEKVDSNSEKFEANVNDVLDDLNIINGDGDTDMNVGTADLTLSDTNAITDFSDLDGCKRSVSPSPSMTSTITSSDVSWDEDLLTEKQKFEQVDSNKEKFEANLNDALDAHKMINGDGDTDMNVGTADPDVGDTNADLDFNDLDDCKSSVSPSSTISSPRSETSWISSSDTSSNEELFSYKTTEINHDPEFEFCTNKVGEHPTSSGLTGSFRNWNKVMMNRPTQCNGYRPAPSSMDQELSPATDLAGPSSSTEGPICADGNQLMMNGLTQCNENRPVPASIDQELPPATDLAGPSSSTEGPSCAALPAQSGSVSGKKTVSPALSTEMLSHFNHFVSDDSDSGVLGTWRDRFWSTQQALKKDNVGLEWLIERYSKQTSPPPCVSAIEHIHKPIGFLCDVIVNESVPEDVFSITILDDVKKLQRLEVELKLFYESIDVEQSSLKAKDLIEGYYYAVYLSRAERWVRCQLVEKTGVANSEFRSSSPGTVKVLMKFLDYGKYLDTIYEDVLVLPIATKFLNSPQMGYIIRPTREEGWGLDVTRENIVGNTYSVLIHYGPPEFLPGHVHFPILTGTFVGPTMRCVPHDEIRYVNL